MSGVVPAVNAGREAVVLGDVEGLGRCGFQGQGFELRGKGKDLAREGSRLDPVEGCVHLNDHPFPHLLVPDRALVGCRVGVARRGDFGPVPLLCDEFLLVQEVVGEGPV